MEPTLQLTDISPLPMVNPSINPSINPTVNSTLVVPAISLGELAQQIIADQCDRIFSQTAAVLADQDIEPLHQMRVGTRRLRAALQVFGLVIQLPNPAQKHLKTLATILGKVRDLDVQLHSLKTDYYPQLPDSEQQQLKRIMAKLHRRRQKDFSRLKKWLKSDRFTTLQTVYEQWLHNPNYTALGTLPVQLLLSCPTDLVTEPSAEGSKPSPQFQTNLFTHLLLNSSIDVFQTHRGWQVIADALVEPLALHNLRKAGKHLRYQTEFFQPLYGDRFSPLIQPLKQLQDDLGRWQDGQVLLALLPAKNSKLSTLKRIIQTTQIAILSNLATEVQRFDFRL
jgi:CHAD domain-containing protein